MRLVVRLVTGVLTACLLFAGSAVAVGRALPDEGRLTFESNRTGDIDLYALDLSRGRLHNITRHPATDEDAAWSPDGRKLAFISGRDGFRALYLLDLADGTQRRLVNQRIANDYRPVWSPDSRWLVYEVLHYGIDLYILDTDAPEIRPRRLVNDPTDARFPVWSPRGDRIAFVSWRDGSADIFSIAPDGSRLINLTDHPAWDVLPVWSPDGDSLLFQSDRAEGTNLYLMRADGREVQRVTRDTRYFWSPPDWSPDGKQITFVAAFRLNTGMAVIDRDGTDMRLLSSHASLDAQPRWMPNGRDILFMSYRGGRWGLYALDGQTGRSLRRLTPRCTETVMVFCADDAYPVWWP